MPDTILQPIAIAVRRIPRAGGKPPVYLLRTPSGDLGTYPTHEGATDARGAILLAALLCAEPLLVLATAAAVVSRERDNQAPR